MNRTGIQLAIVAALMATLSFPAFAASRHSGGRTAHSGGHAGAHYSGGHGGGRYYSGARYYAPRAAVYLGVPLVAAAAYYGPRYYYPPVHVAGGPGILYYCAAYNDYYPRVQVCPGGWQHVIQPPVAPYPPGYAPAPYY